MRKLFFMLFTLILLSIPAFSQKSNESKSELKPSGLVLEVKFMHDRAPAFQPYTERNSRFAYSWYSLFGRVANFKQIPGSLPVRAVNIIPQIEKNSVIVSVSVFTGVKMHEKEEPVGVYTLMENERIIVKELTSFGVEPFEIALVRCAPTITAVPNVVNNTKSLQVINLIPNLSSMPSLTMQLQNISNKPVVAFSFETKLGAKKMASAMPQGSFGAVLIEAGRNYEKEFPSALKISECQKDANPEVALDETLYIRSVIFADDTFEGNAGDAQLFFAFTAGRKIALKQIIQLLDQYAASEDIAQRIEKFQIAPDESVLAEFMKKFSLPNPGKAAEIAANGTKVEFQKAFASIKFQTPEEKLAKLNELKDEYRKWLARLP